MPDAVEIDGQEYVINTSYKDCLRIILAFEDTELANIEKQMVLLSILYPVQPENTQAAIMQGMKFLNGGADGEEKKEEVPLRLYSFEHDARLIYAAFKQTHNIDLQKEDLHWWQFMALFLDLGADTTWCNLVNLRQKVKTGKATKEEKQAAREMGELFELPEPDDRTPEEKAAEAEFMRLIGQNNNG